MMMWFIIKWKEYHIDLQIELILSNVFICSHSQTEGELTGVHLVMCRWFGVIMLGTAVKMYFN